MIYKDEKGEQVSPDKFSMTYAVYGWVKPCA
jgi:hypothetical protein